MALLRNVRAGRQEFRAPGILHDGTAPANPSDAEADDEADDGADAWPTAPGTPPAAPPDPRNHGPPPPLFLAGTAPDRPHRAGVRRVDRCRFVTSARRRC
ncbi:hypothetical protein Stube_41630 [Streptomyces tubercidicus]|uniref:Uncharacterized protein n=1 Tax=Streptomyces tubercidicus TaxID=47759 RepID=A0A640UVR0_9ACTN|nr:hypothetical protein Stube_41630 [Streptomyces tubercidicus]